MPLTAADTTKAVDALMTSLQHAAKEEIEFLRATILAAHPSIQEGVKWSAPSFRTTEYFATINLRTKVGVGVVLHLGAKPRGDGVIVDLIPDRTHLLQWKAKDRATVDFKDLADLESKKTAFQAILKHWIKHV
ncbi:hypothetical protein BWI17_12335 [Betaproteobacteria bacterium GR16-43]|nr:hypothetical protein BWI17_12335 [Betaproteobacteria bacterium GR16-43]